MNANEPAFPISLESSKYHTAAGVVHFGCGLTKREYFAAMTLQSVISNPAIVFHGGKQDSMFTDEITMSGLVSYSIKYADELIKQLEDGRP